MDSPIAETYERELLFMPYRKSLQKVLEIIIAQSPRGGNLLDLMCGPGYLLGKIAEQRPDLFLSGLDLDYRYIAHSQKRYSGIDLEIADVLNWHTPNRFDVVICTGALHHIPYERQVDVVKKMALLKKPHGLVILSDAYIDDYASELERKIAAARLGYEYLRETILNGAPLDVVRATADIISNDVVMDEFKTSLNKRLPIIKDSFSSVELLKTWPDIESQYGDYILVCR